MTEVLYINIDLNKIAEGEVIASNVDKLEEVYQNAVITEEELDLEVKQTIVKHCPLGYRLVETDDTEYQKVNGKVFVPVQVEYGNVQVFKKDAFEIHENKSSEYFQLWLLCAFLSDSLPFDVAARMKSWFGED